MNIEKAIKSMKNIIEYWTYKPTEVKAAKLAIKALEKQIPMKPYDISKIYTGEKVGHCECGYSHDVLEHEEYCHYCGQKLDWE